MASQASASQKIMLDDVEMTPFLKKVTLFSAGGPFLDGFVLSIIGVAIDQMVRQGDMDLDSSAISAISVAALIGLFLGTLVGGYVTDRIGRKRMFVIDLIGIAVISLATAFVSTPLALIILRFLIGIVIGADYPIATSMIAEFTPRKYRAISMGFIAAVWYVGANAAYLLGYFLADVDGGWRWMLGSAVIPCVVILLGRWNIPESPRWLAGQGRVDEANKIVEEIFGAQVELEAVSSVKTKYSKLFKWEYLSKVLFVGTIWLCQAVPLFAIYTFGPIIMKAFGLEDARQNLLGEVLIGTFFMIGCIPAMFWANSMGRRKLLIGSFFMMTIALAVLGILPITSTFMVIACFAVYAFFSGGPGNLQWLYPNELFPTDIRASAVGAAMAFSRIGTVISIWVLPGFLEEHGTGPTMIAGAIISAIGLIVSILMAPETRGLTLVQTSTLGLGRSGTSAEAPPKA